MKKVESVESIIVSLDSKKEYCIMVNSQYAVDLSREIIGNYCYKRIVINGQFLAQAEIVIDEPGKYNGLENKWVSFGFVPGNKVETLLKWFVDNGFSNCFATIEQEDSQNSDYIPERKEISFYIPGKTVKDLKQGEFFTLKPIQYPKDTQVYTRGEYDRETKKYCCGKWSNISYSRLLKGNTRVYTDFIF